MKQALLFLGILFSSLVQAQGDTVKNVILEKTVIATDMIVFTGCDSFGVNMPMEFTQFSDRPDREMMVELVNIKELRMVIFDNRGKEIFVVELRGVYNPQTDIHNNQYIKKYSTSWRGMYREKLLPEGAYYYVLEMTPLKGKRCRKTSNVTLRHHQLKH